MRRTLALFLLLLPTALHAYEVELLQDNGPPANRYDIAILGDGYRDIDQAKMTQDAKSFLAKFWQQVPFGNYQGYFNVKLVHVISNENGADNGSYGASRDTALGAYFFCNNIERLLCVNLSTVNSVANSHVPERDTIFVMVNDPKYGGAGYPGVAVFSVHASAAEIAEHEFGHSFGLLADEYEDAYPGYPACSGDCPEPNVTTRTTLEQIKWNLWIDPGTPLPTPETSSYTNVVGAFEGARYQTSGVYRPRLNCKMRALGAAFCQVCAEAMVWATYRVVDPIDAVDPAGPQDLSACGQLDFAVTHPSPEPDSLMFKWLFDGQLMATGSDHFTLEGQLLTTGAHTLKVEVNDLTTLVRSDPSGLLASSYSWQINITGSASGNCMIDGRCFLAGQIDPQNPCRKCDPALNPSGWTADDSLVCDDGLFCNGAESCSGGNCLAGTAPCADDGLDCTATCDEQSKQCNKLQAGFCLIDGVCLAAGSRSGQNPCLACLPEKTTSAWSPLDGDSCDDGLFCNGTDLCRAGSCSEHSGDPCVGGPVCASVCDEQRKTCHLPAGSPCADDGNVCTDDLCDGQGECGHPFNQAFCSDGVFCNGEERCLGGACRPGPVPCADGLECTEDLCLEQEKACRFETKPGFCAIAGACVSAGEHQEGNSCRVCDDSRPGEWTALEGNACDDGDACTRGEVCRAGQCQPAERLCSRECPCPEMVGGCGCGGSGSGGALLFLPAVFFLRPRRRK